MDKILQDKGVGEGVKKLQNSVHVVDEPTYHTIKVPKIVCEL